MAAHDREELRAQRSRMVAIAAVVAGALIGGAVIYSTGLLDRKGSVAATHPPASATPDRPATDATTGAPAAAPVADPTAEPARPTPAPAARTPASTGTLAYGLQVASFRTAGRAARVLRDLETTTGLPGEVLTNETEDEVWYRIVVGRFDDEGLARQKADDLLQRSLIAEAIVIPYRPQGR
jgi:cell division protein FtsN